MGQKAEFYPPAHLQVLQACFWAASSSSDSDLDVIMAVSFQLLHLLLQLSPLCHYSTQYHDGVITHLEPDILECEVKWALGSITMNKASGGDGIPIELFQILKDDAMKLLHSICQQIWKTQQWPQDWKWSGSF